MLPIAQGSALGERRPRLIHSAFLRQRKNATRRKRVTHYTLNATRGVAPHKAGCSYRARHFNQCNIVSPGRCPGLSAAIGLTARHTCAADAMKSCIYMNVCARRAQRPSSLLLCRVAAKCLLKTNLFQDNPSLLKCLHAQLFSGKRLKNKQIA